MMRRASLLALVLILVSACSNVPSPQVTTPTVPAVEASPTSQPASPTSPPPSATSAPATEAPPTVTAAPTATPEPVAYGPDNFPANVNPLTGMQVSDPTLLDRYPVMVKVQIVPRGQRPPWGVSLADIVYDYYQNNGATRFTAIFYGTDAEQVGPIRSGRLLDGSLLQMYKTVFAFGSADRRILNRLNASTTSNRLVLEGASNCPPMCRIDPNGYNFLVTDTAEVTKYTTAQGLQNTRQNLNGMRFDPKAAAGGEAAQQVFMRFNFSDYNRWDYDPATGKYLRFQDTQDAAEPANEVYTELIDQLNNEQIAADNVVMLWATHQYAYKSGNSEIIDITFTGSGNAVAFRDGQAYAVKWNRPAADSVLYLTFPDGSLYPFKPGNTWFQVVGQTSQVTKPEEGAWRITFAIP